MAACTAFAIAESPFLVQNRHKPPRGGLWRAIRFAKASPAAIRKGISRLAFAKPSQAAILERQIAILGRASIAAFANQALHAVPGPPVIP